MAFVKNSRLFGRDHAHQLQFRAEMFNLFNRVQFGVPNLTLVVTGVAGYRINPIFGQITTQRNNPRSMQVIRGTSSERRVTGVPPLGRPICRRCLGREGYRLGPRFRKDAITMRGANAADQIVAQQLHGATGKGGLRSCEVIALNREDIQLPELQIRVRGKGRRIRVLPLDPDSVKLVDHYIRLERPPHCGQALIRFA